MLEVLFGSKAARRLTIFGIAIPFSLILIFREFYRRNWGDPDVIMWIGIAAAFWWIFGMFATGVYLIRDAVRKEGLAKITRSTNSRGTTSPPGS